MYGFTAYVFDGKRTAHKALEALEDFTPAYLWIDNVAELSRSKHGSVRVHSTWAQDDSAPGAGAAIGALTAGTVGLLFGPAGAALGALAGGSLGGLIGASENLAFDDPVLDDFVASLEKDTSALVLIGEQPTLDAFGVAVGPFGGRLVQTNLNEGDVKAIRKTLKYPD